MFIKYKHNFIVNEYNQNSTSETALFIPNLDLLLAANEKEKQYITNFIQLYFFLTLK